MRLGKILIPMSRSQSSMAALRAARKLAQQQAYRLILLHVVEPQVPPGGAGRDGEGCAPPPSAAALAQGRRLLVQRWESLNAPMAAVDRIVRSADLVDAIVAEARLREVDLVIMGRGRAAASSPSWGVASLQDRVAQALDVEIIVVDERGAVQTR